MKRISLPGFLLARAALTAGCATVPGHEPIGVEREDSPAAASDEVTASDAADESKPSSEQAEPITAAAEASAASPAARETSPASRDSTSAAPSAGDRAARVTEVPSAAFTEIIAELDSLGALDRDSQQSLIEDLQRTDPAVWPQLLEVFKASVAYRKRQAAPEQVPSSSSPTGEVASDTVAASGPSSASGLPSPSAAELKAEQISASAATVVAPAPTSAAATAVVPTPAPPSEPAPVAASSAPSIAATSTTAPPTASSSSVPAPTAVEPSSAPQVLQSAAATTGAQPAAASPGDWKSHVHAAITALEQQNAGTPSSGDEVRLHAALRMLYLVDDRRQEAVRPISGVSPAQQDFWSKQLYALATYLDASTNPDASRRAAEAAVHLREASQRLAEIATLHLKNLAFCTEVTSYGVYKPFDSREFQPGQEVLLYAEVENFKTESTEQGYHTALRSSYQILDAQGARVADHEFAVTEEHCQNPRRDFFIRYFVWMPKRIYGGRYTLQLTIEDTLSRKLGQASIDFTIKDSAN